MDRKRESERRSGGDRRVMEDRRAGEERRRDRDRATARRIPDDFAQAGGGVGQRIAGLVMRHWPGSSADARSDLSRQLEPLLGDLLKPGTPVTEKHRDRCEEIVLAWLERGKG